MKEAGKKPIISTALKVRIGLVIMGVFLIFASEADLRAGHWIGRNGWGQEVWIPAGIGGGILAIVLGILPLGWLFRRDVTQ